MKALPSVTLMSVSRFSYSNIEAVLLSYLL